MNELSDMIMDIWSVVKHMSQTIHNLESRVIELENNMPMNKEQRNELQRKRIDWLIENKDLWYRKNDCNVNDIIFAMKRVGLYRGRCKEINGNFVMKQAAKQIESNK